MAVFRTNRRHGVGFELTMTPPPINTQARIEREVIGCQRAEFLTGLLVELPDVQSFLILRIDAKMEQYLTLLDVWCLRVDTVFDHDQGHVHEAYNNRVV